MGGRGVLMQNETGLFHSFNTFQPNITHYISAVQINSYLTNNSYFYLGWFKFVRFTCVLFYIELRLSHGFQITHFDLRSGPRCQVRTLISSLPPTISFSLTHYLT